jgi:hypothetical protein
LGDDQWDSVDGWSPSNQDDDGYYTRYESSCDLNNNGCGAATFGTGTLSFKKSLIQQGGARTRSIESAKVTLENGVVLNTAPHGVGVDFTCEYSTSVSVKSNEFDLTPVTVSGSTSAEGELDSGFHLTVNNNDGTTIVLGASVDVSVTWDLSFDDVSHHYKECTVGHVNGNTNVALIKEGCHAADIGVGAPSGADFSFETFTIEGESGTTQVITCKVEICNGAGNCAKGDTCPSNSGFGYA